MATGSFPENLKSFGPCHQEVGGKNCQNDKNLSKIMFIWCSFVHKNDLQWPWFRSIYYFL